MDYISEWEFIAEAYNGYGGFSDGSAIEKFRRETDDSYDERKKSAKREYENIFVSKISRYVGYLFKSTPARETENALLKTIIQDANLKGESIDVFMSSFAQNAKARGVNLLLVESPDSEAENLGEQIDKRLTPYFTEILPERVISYKINKFGRFDYVAFSDIEDKSTFGNSDVEDIIRYYDKEVWRIYDADGNIIDEQPHGLGECPVLIFSEKGSFESLGEFSQLAGMSKRLYNNDSELKLLLRGQTFSLLTVQAEKGSDPDIKVGVDNVLLYYGDKAPAYISSDAQQAATYEYRIEKIKEAMDRVAYDVTTTAARESGIALSIKFDALNASLNKFSQRLEDIERTAWNLVCVKLGLHPETIGIVYNMDFSITDLNMEIETLNGISTVADLPLYKAEKLKSLVKEDLKSAESETLDAIFEEIDTNVGKMSEYTYTEGEQATE